MMKKERLLAYLFAFLAIYFLIANFSIYKSFVVVAIAIILIALGFSVLAQKYKSHSKEEAILYFSAWSFIYLWAYVFSGESIGLGTIAILVYTIMYLSLSLDYQLKIAKYFIWVLSVLCFFSIIEFVFYIATGKGIILQYVTRTTVIQSTYFNHLLFNIIRISDLVLRFQGLADEPGRMGTLCGMLLFLTRRLDISKWPFYIFLFCGLLSFSLAFYILLVIFYITSAKVEFKKTFAILCIMSLALWMVQEQFSSRILERISDFENVDNRTDDVFDSYFDAAVKSGAIWVGVGNEQVSRISEESGEGYGGAKVFMMRYGIISVIVLFIMYNYIYIKRCRGRIDHYDWLFLLAFWLSFYQRQTIYLPFTMIVFFTMPLAKNRINKFYTDDKKKIGTFKKANGFHTYLRNGKDKSKQ